MYGNESNHENLLKMKAILTIAFISYEHLLHPNFYHKFLLTNIWMYSAKTCDENLLRPPWKLFHVSFPVYKIVNDIII